MTVARGTYSSLRTGISAPSSADALTADSKAPVPVDRRMVTAEAQLANTGSLGSTAASPAFVLAQALAPRGVVRDEHLARDARTGRVPHGTARLVLSVGAIEDSVELLAR